MKKALALRSQKATASQVSTGWKVERKRSSARKTAKPAMRSAQTRLVRVGSFVWGTSLAGARSQPANPAAKKDAQASTQGTSNPARLKRTRAIPKRSISNVTRPTPKP